MSVLMVPGRQDETRRSAHLHADETAWRNPPKRGELHRQLTSIPEPAAALLQHHGEHWDTWNQSVTGQLLERQISDGSAAGSWHPLDRWAIIDGPVYQTAICALTLEVYYRYLPLYTLKSELGTDP